MPLELGGQGTQGECDENMFCTTRVFSFPFLPSFPTSSLRPAPCQGWCQPCPECLLNSTPLTRPLLLASLSAFLVNDFVCGRPFLAPSAAQITRNKALILKHKTGGLA